MRVALNHDSRVNNKTTQRQLAKKRSNTVKKFINTK